MTDDEILSVFASGVASGAATALARVGAPRTICDGVAEAIVDDMTHDPAARDEVLSGMRAMMAGEAVRDVTLRMDPRGADGDG